MLGLYLLFDNVAASSSFFPLEGQMIVDNVEARVVDGEFSRIAVVCNARMLVLGIPATNDDKVF